VPCIGKSLLYLCTRNKSKGIMRNTDYTNLENLSNMISSNDSLQALKGLMEDLGLEFEDALSL